MSFIACDTTGFEKGPAASNEDRTVRDEKTGYLAIYDLCLTCGAVTERFVLPRKEWKHYNKCARCAAEEFGL